MALPERIAGSLDVKYVCANSLCALISTALVHVAGSRDPLALLCVQSIYGILAPPLTSLESPCPAFSGPGTGCPWDSSG